MEMRKCETCGEMYSTTYRTCPFCEEEEAMRKGKPMHRHASDFRNKRGGHALGVLALEAGAVGTLTASGGGESYTWSSDNEAVATVDENGTVTAVAAGEAVISVTDGANTVQCAVQVAAVEVDGTLTLNRDDFTMGVGESWQLKVSGTDAAVTWSIENSAVATIAADGTVTGVSSGVTTAYAKVGGQTLECIVRIK